jgi:hypothetical protein
MNKFIWCSAHTPSAEQIAELKSAWGMKGDLVMLKDIYPNVQEALNNTSSEYDELLNLAKDLHEIARSEDAVLVQPGGSPAFQYILGKVRMTSLHMSTVLYAHSERVSTDAHGVDGIVKKITYFKHIKFIQV